VKLHKTQLETQFILKWQHEQIPTFITDGTITPVGTYDHHAILELVATPAWTPEEE
jgi:hypothetical protein